MLGYGINVAFVSRYAVKLMYDEVSLGEVDDFSELADYLESYSTDYFIGLESEKGWEEAVLRQVPHLFSLGRDPEKVKISEIIFCHNSWLENIHVLNRYYLTFPFT